MQTPENFPYESWSTALSGSAVKAGARLIDGKYIAGSTAEERTARYQVCAELLHRLVPYCRQRLCDEPGLKLDVLLEKVERSITSISPVERRWCVHALRELLHQTRA